jgi:hypothetical protein
VDKWREQLKQSAIAKETTAKQIDAVRANAEDNLRINTVKIAKIAPIKAAGTVDYAAVAGHSGPAYRCSGDHQLTKFVCSGIGHVAKEGQDDAVTTVACNVCKKEQPLGSVMYGCRPCDYDICSSCRKPVDTPATEELNGGVRCSSFFGPCLYSSTKNAI